jgi:hypothetical protein
MQLETVFVGESPLQHYSSNTVWNGLEYVGFPAYHKTKLEETKHNREMLKSRSKSNMARLLLDLLKMNSKLD